MRIHFKDNPEKQKRYETIVTEIITFIKSQYGDSAYTETVHRVMVEQYARSLIRAETLEETIDNGEGQKYHYDSLKAERAVQKDIADRLKLHVRAIIGDTRSYQKEKTTDFSQFLEKKLGVCVVEDDLDETDSDNIQQE